MWRRVLSQSPSSVPKDPASMQITREYLDGWKALGALLHGGGSLSGRERNCCFLNTGQPGFADVSSAVGFDHESDSRAIVAIDWDHDGDLDLITANRTAPRVRYLQNDLSTKNRFVSVRLRGVTCNRDAVGAQLELKFHREHAKSIFRSVSAGEGFVSQTTKTIHFGIPIEEKIDRLIVKWPDGIREEFTEIPINQFCEIVQGTNVIQARNRVQRVAFESREAVSTQDDANIRIVLPQPIPFPEFTYNDMESNAVASSELANGPVLINLWATWCQPCVAEIAEWTSDYAKSKDNQLRIVCLNVDNASTGPRKRVQDITAAWRGIDSSLELGIIDQATLELFELVDRTLLLQQTDLPIPISFLLDSSHRLIAVYKGRTKLATIVRDSRILTDTTTSDGRDLAIPFRGKWYSDPFPVDLIAIPSQMVGLGRGFDSYRYLKTHITAGITEKSDVWPWLGVTKTKLISILDGTGQLLIAENKISEAIEMFNAIVVLDPKDWDAHVQLCSLLIRTNRAAEALQWSRIMSRLKPNHPLPWTNVAWILATSDDDTIRNPDKAVEVAEKICKATNRKEPSALDTLAIAYDAVGRSADALQAAQDALAAARKIGKKDLIEYCQRRFEVFKKRNEN